MNNRREYMRGYQNRWMQQRRTDWILANGPCQICGSWDNLEVDHIDASQKELNPSAIWSRRQEIREAELAKCQVLCNPCHIAKSIANKECRRGSQASWAILTEADVIILRELYAAGGVTFRELGERYGVHRDTVRKAVRKTGWQHVN